PALAQERRTDELAARLRATGDLADRPHRVGNHVQAAERDEQVGASVLVGQRFHVRDPGLDLRQPPLGGARRVRSTMPSAMSPARYSTCCPGESARSATPPPHGTSITVAPAPARSIALIARYSGLASIPHRVRPIACISQGRSM